MSLGHGASIVRDNLVLYLDAANLKSYTGEGTNWTDLSGNNNNAALYNGPVYSSLNLGSISFDNSNDYCEVTNRTSQLEFQPTQPFSLSVWFKTSIIPGQGAILSNMLSSPPYSGYDIWIQDDVDNKMLSSHMISTWTVDAIKVKVDYSYTNFLNTWTSLTITYDGSSPTNTTNMVSSMDFYINGGLYTVGKAGYSGADGFNTTSATIAYNENQRFRIASRYAASLSQGSAVTVGNVMVYSKRLTAEEVMQNFNALRGRYNI